MNILGRRGFLCYHLIYTSDIPHSENLEEMLRHTYEKITYWRSHHWPQPRPGLASLVLQDSMTHDHHLSTGVPSFSQTV